jgi:tetratricopeptide (TPR) repeat protein
MEIDAESEDICRVAIANAAIQLGENHPYLCAFRVSIARFHYIRGEYDEAETLLRQVTDRLSVIMGPEHFYTCIAYWYLGDVLAKLGRTTEALPYFELALVTKACPHCVLLMRKSRIDALLQLGRIDDAVEESRTLLQDTLSFVWRPDESSLTYILKSAIAHIAAYQGRLEEARETLQVCCDKLREGVGENHPFYSDAHTALSNVLLAEEAAAAAGPAAAASSAEAYRRLSFIAEKKKNVAATPAKEDAGPEPDAAAKKATVDRDGDSNGARRRKSSFFSLLMNSAE